MRKSSVAIIIAIAVILVCQVNSIETKEENIPLRKLGFDFNIEKIFDIKSFTFLGQKLTFKYRVAVQNGKAINHIIIESDLGSFKLGNTGVDTETRKMWSEKIKILTYRFPPLPSVTVGIYASGDLHYSVKYASDSKDSLELSLSGDLKAGSEVIGVTTDMTKMTAGASGNLISVSGTATVTKNDIIKGFKFYGTTVNTWVEAKVGLTQLWKKSYKLFDNWSYS